MPVEAAPPAPPVPTEDSTSVTPKIEQPKLSQETKAAVQKAAGGMGTKVVIWIVGIFSLLAGLVGLIYIFKGKGNGPVNASKAAVTKAKAESSKADLEAKIKVAEAKSDEKEVLAKLKEIKEMDDEDARLDALNAML